MAKPNKNLQKKKNTTLKSAVSTKNETNFELEVRDKLNILEKNQKIIIAKLNKLINMKQNNTSDAPAQNKKKQTAQIKNTKNKSSINGEILPKKTCTIRNRIGKFINTHWKLFLPHNSSQEEKKYFAQIFQLPVYKAFKAIQEKLKKDSNNHFWADSVKEIDQQLKNIVTNEIFNCLETKFIEVVKYHEQLDSSRAKTLAALESSKMKLLVHFGIEVIPVSIGEDTFEENIHDEYEKNRDLSKQDYAILSVLKNGYRYRETGEILKKVKVSVNYRY